MRRTTKKILFCASNEKFLNIMGKYLSWYGFSVDCFDKSSVGMFKKLKEDSYNLLICDVLSEPNNGYWVCKKIRNSRNKKIKDQSILLIGYDNPDKEQYIFLKKKNIYFMDKCQDAEAWFEKIQFIIEK